MLQLKLKFFDMKLKLRLSQAMLRILTAYLKLEPEIMLILNMIAILSHIMY
jgi:hypothetical protein